MCFEILGIDILIDKKLKPWLLEINIQPSFSTDSPLDFRIKKGVVDEAFSLLNLSYNRKIRYKNKEKRDFEKRCMTGKYNRPSQ